MTDTSELFIKMADCPEIQDQKFSTGHCKLFEVGDRYAWRNNPHHEIHISVTGTLAAMTCIWLPTQPQLQDMSGLSWYLFDKTCVTWATVNTEYQMNPKEITAIQVMMQEKFGKRWVENKWEAQ